MMKPGRFLTEIEDRKTTEILELDGGLPRLTAGEENQLLDAPDDDEDQTKALPSSDLPF